MQMKEVLIHMNIKFQIKKNTCLKNYEDTKFIQFIVIMLLNLQI